MVYIKLMLFVVVAVASVSGRPTHCERHEGDSQFRCGKDDYRADRVHIRNIAGTNVSFKVGKWLSTCGSPGTNYADNEYSLGSGGNMDVDFGEAGPGACNEIFIYNCKINGQGRNCIDAVSVYPN